MRRKAKKNMSKYINAWRADAMAKAVGGKLSSGRETAPIWFNEYAMISQLKMPLKRAYHRNKNLIEALKIIRDINPDASMAVWNFLRLANQGHKVEVFDINGENDEEMQEYINEELAPRLGKIYGGGTDQLINVLNLTAYTQGAAAIEVELSKDLADVVDFHAIDPNRLDFVPDPETNELKLCQKQPGGRYTELNAEQVFYAPLDPDVDDPYGRSPILPAVETIIFQAEVLADLKAVAHHQGHARFDISVSSQALIDNMPEEVLRDKEKTNEFVGNYMSAVEEAFADLEADDDFYHADTMKIETVGGTGGKSMDATDLIAILDQQVISSLKQLPILLGRNHTVTETHGSVQWEIQVAGVQSIQRLTKRLMEKAYTVALRARGSQSSVKVTFNEVRSKDRQAEAKAEATEIKNAISKVTQGWIDNDEAANTIVGHDAVDEPKQQMAGLSGMQYQKYLSQLKGSEEGEDGEETEKRSYQEFPSEIFLKK